MKKIKTANTRRVRVPAQQLAEVVNLSEARRQAAIQYREKAREAEAEAASHKARGERIQRIAIGAGITLSILMCSLAVALVLSW